METIARVRRAFHVQVWPVRRIARELQVSRNTVRKILRSDETDFSQEREWQPMPRIGPWQQKRDEVLLGNASKPSRERLTLIRLYEDRAPPATRTAMTPSAATRGPGRRSAGR